MTDSSLETASPSTPFFKDPVNRRWLASAGVLAIGVMVGGYLLGNGLVLSLIHI